MNVWWEWTGWSSVTIMSDIDDNHIWLYILDSMTGAVTNDHLVHYHQTFMNDIKVAAGIDLKLSLKNAPFKILKSNP